jgi:hypothetical protein
VAVAWHRRYLRRYIKLHLGAPVSFTCHGGWHEAIVAIGDYPAEIEKGSTEERQLAPPRTDSRWPRQCSGCDYRFSESDRYQLLTTPLRELDDD